MRASFSEDIDRSRLGSSRMLLRTTSVRKRVYECSSRTVLMKFTDTRSLGRCGEWVGRCA
jgi:hypothetical protein